eukprot:5727711-Pleurochrysis_carterae.AAC.4
MASNRIQESISILCAYVWYYATATMASLCSVCSAFWEQRGMGVLWLCKCVTKLLSGGDRCEVGYAP